MPSTLFTWEWPLHPLLYVNKVSSSSLQERTETRFTPLWVAKTYKNVASLEFPRAAQLHTVGKIAQFTRIVIL